METVFISKLKPFMDVIAERMQLYVPVLNGGHYVYTKYDPQADGDLTVNDIRPCTPVKEFLFPVRELASTFGKSDTLVEVEPFAVFGLKECDLQSMKILDNVFLEEEFEDTLYKQRREKMFIISSDCIGPGDSCFCNLFELKGYPQDGYDLNVSKVKDGFIIESGSNKGKSFIYENSKLFADVPSSLIEERTKNRSDMTLALEQANKNFKFDLPTKEILEQSGESELFDELAKGCIECQACTRVCPTCHCFYLYDVKKDDYFAKMKMWDSCMRFGYTAVAGGANPNKVLGDRLKHRLMHKFVHFLDRYGIEMCVGCGRCVDADAGGMDLREVLMKLSKEIKKNKV